MEHTALRVRRTTVLASALILIAAGTAAADTITLAWDATPDLTVGGYMLHVGTQSGNYTQDIDVGLATAYGWAGAVAGQRYCFAVSAYNGSHLEGAKSAEICGYSNAYPTLVNPGGRSAVVGQATGLQLQGVDPDGRPVSYAAVGLPPGLSLMASTGYISGTPTTLGTYTVTAIVSDGLLSSSQAFAWSITAAGETTSPTISPPSGTALRGDYYSGVSFDTWVTTRTDSSVDFWWNGSPAANVPDDNFSVRWTGQITAPVTGTYVFSTVSDDGVRLWVGDQLLIDNWTDHASTTDSAVVSLQGGLQYPVRLEYYQRYGDAVIGLMWAYPGQGMQVIPPSAFSTSTPTPPSTWTPISPPSGTALRGDYYSGVSFDTWVTTRTDSSVDFWWNGSPAANVPDDNFSVRWTGQITAPVTGTYVFSTVSDDGVRLWVGDQLLIDNWTDHGSTIDTGVAVSLQGGLQYPVRLEYYQRYGDAVIGLMWAYPGQGTQVIPQSALTP